LYIYTPINYCNKYSIKEHIMKKDHAGLFALSALSLALMALGGCGDSGGGDAAAPPAVAPAQRTVQGTAAKGIIKGAQVQVFSLDAAGKKSAQPSTTAVTAQDGTYSLALPADVLLFSVEVIGGAGATMADEVSGKDVELPAGFKLRSVVKLAQSAQTSITSSVSPLTEMIVQAAEKAGGLSATNIDDAKRGFAEAFGFDPQQVKPVNANSAGAATASEHEKLQSLLLAAISKMAHDGKLGCSAAELSERLSCVAKGIGAIGTLKDGKLELNAAIQSDLRQALTDVAGNGTINRTGNASANGLPSFPPVMPVPPVTPVTPATPATPVPPVPPVTPPPTDVQLAKKLFASLRTNANLFSTSAAQSDLEVRGEAMKADFDKAIAPLDQNIIDWLQVSRTGLDHLRSFQAGATYNSAVYMYDHGYYSSCIVYSSPSETLEARAAEEVDHISCNRIQNITDNWIWNGSDYELQIIIERISITPVPGSSTSYTYRSRASKRTMGYWASETDTESPIGDYGNTDNIADGTIEYAQSGALVSKLAVSGKLLARYDRSGVAITDHELVNLSATRSAEGGNVYKYALSGELASVKGAVQVGKVSIKPGSFARIKELAEGKSNHRSIKEVALLISAESGGSKVDGALALSKPMGDKNGRAYKATSLTFSGSLASNKTEFFSGILSYEQTGYDKYDVRRAESASNFTTKNVALSGTLNILNRPQLSLALSTNQTAFQRSSASGQYKDGSATVNVSVSDTSPRVTQIDSTDGVAFKYSAGMATVDVVKDGAKVAVINVNKGVIDYVDGAFESLK
jgi:hypothetical protein